MTRESPFFQEKDLIPFETCNPPKGPNLILSPHPDDEVFGLGGTLALMKQQNIENTVIYVTDGGLGGDPRIRKQEALNALKILGVRNFEFWNIMDRTLFNEKEKLFSKLLSLFKTTKYETIFLPSFQEYHPDHRALTFYTLEFLKEYNPSLDIWLYEINRIGEANRMIDITPVASYKEKAINCYKSQLATSNYFNISLAINTIRSLSVANKNNFFVEAFFNGRADKIKEIYQDHIERYFLQSLNN